MLRLPCTLEQITCTLCENKDKHRVLLRQLTYYDNNVGIVYTSYRESANSDTTKANDNVTTFQDQCQSAKSWLRVQDGWGGEKICLWPLVYFSRNSVLVPPRKTRTQFRLKRQHRHARFSTATQGYVTCVKCGQLALAAEGCLDSCLATVIVQCMHHLSSFPLLASRHHHSCITRSLATKSIHCKDYFNIY